MDLTKFLKLTECSLSESDYQLPSTSRGTEDISGLDGIFSQPNVPLVKTGLTPAAPTIPTEASGEIWPNKQVWQYMTLPFTITLALQNLSPDGKNLVDNPPVTETTTKYLHVPWNPKATIPAIDNNATATNPLQEMLNLSRRISETGENTSVANQDKDEPKVTESSPKRKRRSRAIYNLKKKLTDVDIFRVPTNYGENGNRNTDASLNAPNFTKPFSFASNSDQVDDQYYVKHLFKIDPPKSIMKKGTSTKRKAEDEPTLNQSEVTDGDELKTDNIANNSGQVLPYLLLCPNNQFNKTADQTEFKTPTPSCIKYASKTGKVQKSKKLMEQNTGTETARAVKRVRFSDEVQVEEHNAPKETQPSDLPEIRKIVYPIFNRKKSPKRRYKKDNPQPAVPMETSEINQEEINSTRLTYHSLNIVEKQYINNIMQTNIFDLNEPEDLSNIEVQDIPLELTKSKKDIYTPIFKAMPASDLRRLSNLLLPTAYQRLLLSRLSQERLRRAYNLHESLIEKLGGTNAMPERRLEIDLFRRDLVLELIRKEFEVVNLEELREAILKYLAQQESYSGIIHDATQKD